MKNKFFYAAFLLVFLVLTSTILYASGGKKIAPVRQKFINEAMTYQNVPYVYGGKTKLGFDCSGFVTYTIRKVFCSEESVTQQNKETAEYINKLVKAASAQNLYDRTVHISEKEREPGDLIFFSSTKDSKKTHVGIYLGRYHSPKGNRPDLEGKYVFISAVSDGPETGVVIRPIEEKYWASHYPVYSTFLRPSN
mgnify:CR=1 FL=1